MLAGCAGVKSAFLIKRREAPHFLSVLSSVFGKKSGGIFIKPNLKAAENKGWRIRETICNYRRKQIGHGCIWSIKIRRWDNWVFKRQV